MYSNRIWFNTDTFPRNIVKTLERRKPSCEFCLVTDKIAKVREFGDLRHIWFESIHSTDSSETCNRIFIAFLQFFLLFYYQV